MRYIPVTDVHRRHVADGWHWRYLRGIQCVLSATHGIVSPNPGFVARAFGKTFEEFLEILSMPDRYIMYRTKYADGPARNWRKRFRRLSPSSRKEFLDTLADLNCADSKTLVGRKKQRYGRLVEHYYPDGTVVRE